MEQTTKQQADYWKNVYNVQRHLEGQKICDNVHRNLVEMIRNGTFKIDK